MNLLARAWLLLFPMIVAASTAFSADLNEIHDRFFDPHYRIQIEQIRLLNRQQIGVAFRVSDQRGMNYKVGSSAIGTVRLNNRNMSNWTLDWREAFNPYNGIHPLNGFSQYFDTHYSGLRAIPDYLLKNHRTANRIEMVRIKDKTLVHSRRSIPFEQARLIRLIRKQLMQTHQFSKFRDIQVVWRSRPSEAMIKLLENRDETKRFFSKLKSNQKVAKKSRGGIGYGPNQAEKRMLHRLLNSRYRTLIKEAGFEPISSNDRLIQFSAIDQAIFFDVEIIDRTTRPEHRVYHYRPAKLGIFTYSFMPNGVSNHAFPDIKRFMDLFETDFGQNRLVLTVSQNDINTDGLSINTAITTPDHRQHDLNIRLLLSSGTITTQRCRKSYVYQEGLRHDCQLAQVDQELIAVWNGESPDSKWFFKSRELTQLYEQKNYSQYTEQSTAILALNRLPFEVPVPIQADWTYYTAESFRLMDQPAKALDWYRKLVRDFPYCRHYSNAWYRMLEEQGKAVLFR